MRAAATGFAMTLVAMAACSEPAGQVAGPHDQLAPSAGLAESAGTPVSGDFVQTGVTGYSERAAGRNTIINQTSIGVMTGSMTGSFEDELRVIIHPNGTFTTQGSLTCQCVVDGKEGWLTFVIADRGEITGPESAAFSGRAVIRAAGGELSGMRGVLDIEGVVNTGNGLSTYAYSGALR